MAVKPWGVVWDCKAVGVGLVGGAVAIVAGEDIGATTAAALATTGM